MQILDERRSLRATADFAPGFQDSGVRPKEMVSDPERQLNVGVPDTRDLGLKGKMALLTSFVTSCSLLKRK